MSATRSFEYSKFITIRPWGKFRTFLNTDGYVLKEITVNPNCRFSLQYHNHRKEVWTIIKGSGTVELGTGPSTVEVSVGDVVQIELKQIHRMTAGPDGVTFVEVQQGDLLSEDDIWRLEDDYGRVK